MNCLIPDWPAPATVRALVTTRFGGVSRGPYGDGAGGGGLNLASHVGDRWEDVLENRERLQALLPASPVWLNQVHGAQVINLNEATSWEQPAADACIAVGPGRVCGILTADCLPVLFCDTEGSVVAAAHAGWRGLAAGILAQAVTAMRQHTGADILAWLGPAIGPERFEVGTEVREAFLADDGQMAAAFKARDGIPGKYLADIYQLARLQLRRVGVEQVTGGDFCTVSDALRFYSYRRDGVTGRMASVVWIG